MPRLVKSDSGFVLVFSEKELIDLKLVAGNDFELVKTSKKGVWVLIDNNLLFQENQVESKLIKLLSSLSLKDRVQGVFESKLSKEELKVFKKMLEDKKVFEFKLNEKYRKAVYKLPEEINKIKQKISSIKKPVGKDFEVLLTESQAKLFSKNHEKELKDGSIKGLKSFEGVYYVIKSSVFEKISPKILEFMKKNNESTLTLISKELNMNQELIKIVCEFLKEDGLLLEKRKGVYKFIP